MPTVKVRNLKNEEVGDLELSDAVFGVAFNEPLVHAAVRNYLANGRQGLRRLRRHRLPALRRRLLARPSASRSQCSAAR